jgi:hypothetical protein
MTANEIVIKRTGMSAGDATYYVEMAERRVCDYLGLTYGDPLTDLSPYVFAVADIATLYYQKDKSTVALDGKYGYSTESFAEGAVKASHGVMSGSKVYLVYDEAINNVLAGLETKGVVVVRFI